MSIDAPTLFHAKRDDLFRLALYLGVNPHGRTQQELVLQLLWHVQPHVGEHGYGANR